MTGNDSIADFHRSKMNLVMYLQWYKQTSYCHIQAVMNNLKVHNFRLFGCKIWDFGLTQKFLQLVHKQ